MALSVGTQVGTQEEIGQRWLLIDYYNTMMVAISTGSQCRYGGGDAQEKGLLSVKCDIISGLSRSEKLTWLKKLN